MTRYPSRSAFLAAALLVSMTPLAAAVSPDLVISQVYGGGGNAGAPLNSDYMEIFNRGTTTVSLSGLSLQYASATGTGNFSANPVTPLSGSLAPGQYYLVKQAGGATGAALPTPDATGTVAMAATAGKVALVNSTTGLACNGGSTPCSAAQLALIKDLVGYGGANFFEGSAPAPTLSNTTAAFRVLDGCQDTDNNAADFTAATPAPRNSATIDPCQGDAAPAIASKSPDQGATNVALTSNVSITFSEPVDLTGAWYSISCGSSGTHTATVTGGPTTFSLDPDSDFAFSESCTVTITGAQISDQDTDDPPDNVVGNPAWSFRTADPTGCDVPPTHEIAQVQGSGDATPVAGQTVRVEGIVTGDFQGAGGLGGFFIQDDTPDADSNSSEGLFVFSNLAVAVGDRVLVTGRAFEFSGLTELSPVTAVDVCSTGNTISPLIYDLPRASGVTFEPVENMLVTFPETLTATEHFQLGRFGEVTVSSDGRLFEPTTLVDPGPPAAVVQELNNRRRLLIDDGSNVQNPATVPFLTPNVLRLGDTATGVTGVLTFGFGFYRLEPTAPISFSRTNPRPAPVSVGGDIRVASFNTLNYFTTLASDNPNARGANTAEEFSRQQAKEVSAITGLNADVIGLMEVENNGATAIGSLVDALNAATAPGTYDYVSEPSLNAPNEFGGTFGTDAIKVALIYRPAAVTPVGAAQSSADPVFDRPPLVQTFQLSSGSEHFTIAVNHFKSKNCGGATGADLDQGDGQSCFNARRVQQASALVALLDSLEVTNALVIGDLNSHTEEDPIHTLQSAGFAELSESLVPADQRYSFVFNGQSGELDHALADADLVDNVTGASIWHINADEPLILDYNTEFNPPGLYQPDAFRSSDHDPIVIGLDLQESPTQLIVVKHVVNDSGGNAAAGDFTMSVTATNPSTGSFPGDETGTTIALDPGTYEVSETGPSGYAPAFSENCSGTIALGETKTCTVTNNDIAPTLTVTKSVVNAAGADAGRFDLRIDGTTAGTGGNVGDGGTTGAVTVTAGSHTVSETGVSGTTLSDYVVTIGGDCAADGTITLALAQNASCTITNTRKARVTVLKTENGAAPSNAWSFRLSGGPDSVSITRTTTVNDVPAGSGNLDFGVVRPGPGYTLCELAVPAVVTSTFASEPGATVDPATRNICVPLTLGSGAMRSFSVDNAYSQVAQIAAGSTCQQFSTGTAPDLPTLASGGQIEYSVKGNKISQVNPGVFFYWVKVTVGGGNQALVVDQSLQSTNFTRLLSLASGFQPVYTASCGTVRGAVVTQTNGDATVTWSAGTGGTFYVGLKYDTSSLVGASTPGPGTNVDYRFATTGVLGSTDGLRLSKKK